MTDLDVLQHGGVAHVFLDRNTLNTISPELVDELARVLGDLARDSGVDAIVLGSRAEKFFSAGWDLPALLELSRNDMARFLGSFNRLTVELACLPVATVAALEGFAVAGGFILALACDYRVITSANRKVGLTEVDLGLPLPLPASLLLSDVGGHRTARDVGMAGRLLAPQEALAAGLVDAVEEPGEVLAAADRIAGEMASKPSGAIAPLKSLLREPFVAKVASDGARHEASFLDVWFAPGTRRLLGQAAERLVPR